MDVDDNQLKLYYQVAKKLILSLLTEKDRIIASKWIKTIENDVESTKKAKLHIIELLLLNLQRKHLVGPFEYPPGDSLSSYEWCLQPSDIVELILEKEYSEIGNPEVKVELSGDLRQYVAYQNIPNFGTHFFYASSPESITKWTNLDCDIITKGLVDKKTISYPDTSILKKSLDCQKSQNSESNRCPKENTCNQNLCKHRNNENSGAVEELLSRLPSCLRARLSKSIECQKYSECPSAKKQQSSVECFQCSRGKPHSQLLYSPGRCQRDKTDTTEELKKFCSRKSHLSDSEMKMSGFLNEQHHGIPSPIVKECCNKTTKKYQRMKERYENLKAKQKQQKIYQNSFELKPSTFGPCLLDMTNEENSALEEPLIKMPHVGGNKNFLDSYERRLDESLKLLHGSCSTHGSNNKSCKVQMDSNFLDKKIVNGNVPNDASILHEDELVYEDVFDEVDDEYLNKLLNVEKCRIIPENKLYDTINNSIELPLDPLDRLKMTLSKIRQNRMKLWKKHFSNELPYTQLENESFPNPSCNEADGVFLNQGQISSQYNQAQNGASTERYSNLNNKGQLVETPSYLLRLRERYQVMLAQKEIPKPQYTYTGTFKNPFPNLGNGDLPPKDDMDDILDMTERYNPVIKRFLPAEELEDQSIPEGYFVCDENLSPQELSENVIYQEPLVTTRKKEEPIRANTDSVKKHVHCLPLHMLPRDRIELLVEQQPKIRVFPQTSHSEFSPVRFLTEIIPPVNLENESFPNESSDSSALSCGHSFQINANTTKQNFIASKAKCELIQSHNKKNKWEKHKEQNLISEKFSEHVLRETPTRTLIGVKRNPSIIKDKKEICTRNVTKKSKEKIKEFSVKFEPKSKCKITLTPSGNFPLPIKKVQSILRKTNSSNSDYRNQAPTSTYNQCKNKNYKSIKNETKSSKLKK